MAYYLDLDQWHRQDLYEFFRGFEQPFFNVCVQVEVTRLRDYCRSNNLSFFLASLYINVHVANQLKPFAYRLRDDGVIVHEHMDTGTTVMLANDKMVYAYFEYHKEFNTYYQQASSHIEAVKQGIPFDPADDRDDLIHHSILPWMHFTSFMHARRKRHNDSIPKVVFGRYQEQNNKVMMPVSVEVHHALMDGLDVGRYLEQFEHYCMNDDWL